MLMMHLKLLWGRQMKEERAAQKETQVRHGYGLKSIRYTANKYEGRGRGIDTRDHWFDLKVLIPIPERGRGAMLF